ELHRTGPPTGFPLLLKTTTKNEVLQPDKTLQTYIGGSELEVVEFSHATLAPGLFEVPPGFKKVDKIVDPVQDRYRLQALSYWQRFKEALHNMFH
ncbi:MAG TPA: hypothetical protein VE133_16935, partial [Candidatus Sulfotelmatobacter sp.]|nr:hypothetical protein [Candidatus Sulfotelmatobacter sp.]